MHPGTTYTLTEALARLQTITAEATIGGAVHIVEGEAIMVAIAQQVPAFPKDMKRQTIAAVLDFLDGAMPLLPPAQRPDAEAAFAQLASWLAGPLT